MLCSSQQTDLPSSNVSSYIKDNSGALKTWNSNLVIIIRRSPRNSGAVCLSWFQPARSKKIHLIQSRWLSIKYNLVLIGATLTSTCEVCFVVYKSSFKCSNTHFSIWFPMISLRQQHTSYQALHVCVKCREGLVTRLRPSGMAVDSSGCRLWWAPSLVPSLVITTFKMPKIKGPVSDPKALLSGVARSWLLLQPAPLTLPKKEVTTSNLCDCRVVCARPVSFSLRLPWCVFLLEVTLLSRQPCSRLEFALAELFPEDPSLC